MLDNMTLAAEPRTAFGRRPTRRLRDRGSVPVIIYGHGEDPLAASVPAHELGITLDHGAHTLTLDLQGKKQQFLIKEVQYDHLGDTPIHLDLVRFDANERVTVTVGVELRGVPKGVTDGGVLEQHLADIDIECLVTDIPDTLRPLVTHLGLNETLLVKDLELPPGVRLISDGDERVATVRELAEQPESGEATEGETGDAQPEVIGREKKTEEGEKVGN